ncbi:MAG: Gfo/Idh/MocA family oxidoreductase [Verrucomicrobiota bacterium]|jgi:predicted dehydrogenase
MKSLQPLSRRSFLKTLGATVVAAPFVTRDLIARPPGGRLRHASFGAGGMAWQDLNELARFKQLELVAVAEVDLEPAAQLKKRFPEARLYQDWRQMLDSEEKNLDSVNVSTPDHMHALMAMSAMQFGKHVYGQKPLAHDLYEVRRLTEFSARKKLTTQMGIQIHATAHYHTAALLIQAGAIGKIKEVHSWCRKSWGDPTPRPTRQDAVPGGFDWDLWLGVCSPRPFIGQAYYHPANWRKRLDFGTGTFGDMGCHIFDPVFSALHLREPISVRSEGPAPNEWNWALDSRIHYVFDGTPFTAGKTLNLTWYDGAQKPPPDLLALLEGDPIPDTGSLFVGAAGALVLPHIARPVLYPDKKFDGLKYPEVASGNHWGEFVGACLGHNPTSTPFVYSGPLTESVLLGGVASRFPQTTLQWDAAKLQFDLHEANQFVRREYRAGWRLKALA